MQAIQTGFDARLGLMTSTSEGLAYPQPKAGAIPGGHALLNMLGLVLGKALFEGLLVDLPLAPFFVARLQGRHPCLDDMGTLDGDLHRSILQIKRCAGLGSKILGSRSCWEVRMSSVAVPAFSMIWELACAVAQSRLRSPGHKGSSAWASIMIWRPCSDFMCETPSG